MGLLDYLKGLTKRPAASECRVLLLGLDNSGKTTILRRLSDEDILDVRPTQGFVIKSLKQGDFKLNMWDVGGKFLSFFRASLCVRNYFSQGKSQSAHTGRITTTELLRLSMS